MSRSYRHISNYEKEILELKGLTLRETGTKIEFTREQVHNFITREHRQC